MKTHQGRGKHAGMDNCHARAQHSADFAGHGKTVLKGRKSRKEEPFPLEGEHPQKEKVERYAASFQKLADTFLWNAI